MYTFRDSQSVDYDHNQKYVYVRFELFMGQLVF